MLCVANISQDGDPPDDARAISECVPNGSLSRAGMYNPFRIEFVRDESECCTWRTISRDGVPSDDARAISTGVPNGSLSRAGMCNPFRIEFVRDESECCAWRTISRDGDPSDDARAISECVPKVSLSRAGMCNPFRIESSSQNAHEARATPQLPTKPYEIENRRTFALFHQPSCQIRTMLRRAGKS
jgi:hypothetical protein